MERKKTWENKVEEVENSLARCDVDASFARHFYRNLFFLNPRLEKYFKKTDWKHQEIALVSGIERLVGFLKNDEIHRNHVVRIGETHSSRNMAIHPHDYYYWIDALILTAKKRDHQWYDDLEYYFRECLFYPISFIISLYHK